MNESTMKKIKQNCALYIHIPFCVKKCLYCDFLSMPASDALREQYIEALLRELESWERVLKKYRISSVFLGGGTPTCLSPGLFGKFVRGLASFLSGMDVSGDLEFTTEANPGTVLKEHLDVFRTAGINRISLGLQSAQDTELQALGRIHSYGDFIQTYDMIRNHGFFNVNIDLMSDIPRQSIESYEDTLKKVISLQPEHISSYSLIVEEGTPFYKLEQEGKLDIPSEETDRQMYRLTKEMLEEAGYRRYEISNYAREGFACKHNLTYWDTGAYLGAGLGASSCLEGFRFQNTGSVDEYLACYRQVHDLQGVFDDLRFKKKIPVFQMAERWTETARKEEFMFLGLRKMNGVSAADFRERFGVSLWDVYGRVLTELSEKKLLCQSADGDRIFLTERGIDVSNVVLAEFLL